jgi:heme-degrading monooxygenase HmoA
MIVVLFELVPRPGRTATYFDLAVQLREALQATDGFISVERFESLTTPGRYLSLSVWRDEAAVKAWRCQAQHRSAQQAGRSELFADYRLRVASVLRDYGLLERGAVPPDSLGALI